MKEEERGRENKMTAKEGARERDTQKERERETEGDRE